MEYKAKKFDISRNNNNFGLKRTNTTLKTNKFSNLSTNSNTNYNNQIDSLESRLNNLKLTMQANKQKSSNLTQDGNRNLNRYIFNPHISDRLKDKFSDLIRASRPTEPRVQQYNRYNSNTNNRYNNRTDADPIRNQDINQKRQKILALIDTNINNQTRNGSAKRIEPKNYIHNNIHNNIDYKDNQTRIAEMKSKIEKAITGEFMITPLIEMDNSLYNSSNNYSKEPKYQFDDYFFDKNEIQNDFNLFSNKKSRIQFKRYEDLTETDDRIKRNIKISHRKTKSDMTAPQYLSRDGLKYDKHNQSLSYL